jgi:hypothetical protein
VDNTKTDKGELDFQDGKRIKEAKDDYGDW